MDTATLQRPSARSELADLIWEASADLTTEHGQLFQAALQADNAGRPEAAGQLWQQVTAVWSRAWRANHTALELLQHAGLTRFSPVKPHRWVVASFEHHCGPHGLPAPHVHNIVLTDLTTGTPPRPSPHALLPGAVTGTRPLVSYRDRMWASTLQQAALIGARSACHHDATFPAACVGVSGYSRLISANGAGRGCGTPIPAAAGELPSRSSA